MPIPIICSCSAKLKVGDHLKGKQIKCPTCGALIPVGVAEGGGEGFQPAGSEEGRLKTCPTKAPAAQTTEPVLQQSPLSEAERDALEEELQKDEQLLWAGKPDGRAAFLRGLIFTVGLGVFALFVLGALIAFAVAGDLKSGEGKVVAAVLILVTLAAAGAGAAAPYLNRWRMGKTFYAITTKRALAWDCDWAGKVARKAYGPADMANLKRSALGGGGKNDVGDLVFGLKAKTRKTARGTIKTFSRYGFFYVPRAGEVEKLLRETLVDPFLDKLYE